MKVYDNIYTYITQIVGLILYGKTMSNGKSLFLQKSDHKKELTIADIIMITLNNYEMNLLKIQKLRTYSELNDKIDGKYCISSSIH